MKLIITDHADETVGAFPTQYTIEVPFVDEYRDMDDLDAFRQFQIEIYSEFSFGKLTAIYDWEYKQMENL